MRRFAVLVLGGLLSLAEPAWAQVQIMSGAKGTSVPLALTGVAVDANTNALHVAGTGTFTVVQPTGTALHALTDSGSVTTLTQGGNQATINASGRLQVEAVFEGSGGAEILPSAADTDDGLVAGGQSTVALALTLPYSWNGTAWTRDAATPCYLTSAASTNATNCKASAGNLHTISAVNTTTTLYYLRLYNLASAPTCSSATGFVQTIPIPPAGAAGQAGGIVIPLVMGEFYSTGIGFCLTGGGSSTDNTNAATGLYATLRFK